MVLTQYHTRSIQAHVHMPSLTELFLTTNDGLEPIVARELRQRLSARSPSPDVQTRPFGFEGHVLATIPSEHVAAIVSSLRSVHHVSRVIRRFPLPEEDALATIRAEMLQCGIPEMETAGSFRITSKRRGKHNFSSDEVAGAAGSAVVERYGTAVDLEGYDVNLHVDVYSRWCVVNLPMEEISLGRRRRAAFSPRIALRPVVAYGMLSLAELPSTGSVLDPFCGSGTILLEAAEAFPGIELYGSDADENTVEGAGRNAVEAGYEGRIHLQRARAQDIGETYEGLTFSAIVTNPPFGVGLGRGLNYYWLYRDFLLEVPKVLTPDGRIVILIWKRGVFRRVVEDLGLFRVVEERTVEMGLLHPCIYVLSRA